MSKKIFSLLVLSCITAANLSAQITLIQNGKPKSRIVLSEDNRTNRTAGNILNIFLEKCSGTQLQIVTDTKIRKGDLILGGTCPEGVTEDGFYFSCDQHHIRITGKDKGTIYGAVTLLEKYAGVDYWGENEYSCKTLPTLTIPATEFIDNPAFKHRQSQNYALQTDSLYRLMNRLEESRDVFAGGLWVHTARKLLPVEKYGKTHPEYYAYYKGKRHPGTASQLCYTNPEVFEIVAHNIDSIFKANPDKKIISFSQNDGNFTNCTCPECKAIDDREGAYSGSLIYFLNKLAARFPDKEISTLAYLYTEKPPKYIKPLPNVNIMLCNIDCKRELPLTETPTGQQFIKSLKGWSSISKNIFLWDYGINFDNYLTPFPNFHVMKENMELFKKNHVSMHFSQIASSRGGDFAELRTYLASKLMWNLEIDADLTIRHFLDGYYGAAGEYLYEYIKVMEGALIGSGKALWIYDSPVSHKEGMLKPELMRRYAQLFDQAEAAVKNDSVFLKRVQRTRLSLQYSELEIARTEKGSDSQEMEKKLDLFEERVTEFKVPALNERGNSPLDYCQLYRERYMPKKSSLSNGAEVIYLNPPSARYSQLGKTALTDGLYGGSTFVDSWVGWEGKDGEFIVDLGEVKDIHSIETDFLHHTGQWILFPLTVRYSYSTDGKEYTLWEEHQLEENKSFKVLFQKVKSRSETAIPARYVKVFVHGTNVCQAGIMESAILPGSSSTK